MFMGLGLGFRLWGLGFLGFAFIGVYIGYMDLAFRDLGFRVSELFRALVLLAIRAPVAGCILSGPLFLEILM